MEEASKAKTNYVRLLKLSSEDITSAPSRSVGGSAKSKAANFAILLLTYAIKH